MISNQTSSQSTRSKRETRFDVHPLLRYDPEAMNGGIEVLKLEYFEAKTTKAPVPMKFDWIRCKDNIENSTWLGGFEWEC